jgi:biopolymer transport protein ExbD
MNYIKKRLLRKKKGDISFVDLTPMIDIVFILLVFFILTANVAQNVFDLSLPGADENYKEEKEAGDLKQIKITLFTSGQYAIGEEKFQEYFKFKDRIVTIHNTEPKTEFLIISENTLPVEKLMELLTFLKSKNITKIDILLKKQ